MSDHAKEPWPRVLVSVGCAFVGGYMDAVAFLLGKAFAGHITGNSALLAISLAERKWDESLHCVLALICFVAGIMVSTAIDRPLARRATPVTEATGFVVEAAVLIGAIMAFGVTQKHALFLAGACLALGIQDGNLRKTRGATMHTTFMTGMVTATVVGSGELARKGRAHPGMAIASAIWPTFIAGAVAGALLVKFWGVEAVWVPVGALGVFATVDLLSPRKRRQPASD